MCCEEDLCEGVENAGVLEFPTDVLTSYAMQRGAPLVYGRFSFDGEIFPMK